MGWGYVLASREEDVLQDIDCWVGANGVSIKNQDTGLQHGHIYFELEAQLTGSGDWVPSWWYTGQPDYYIIVQGDILRLIPKTTLTDYVADHGWLKTATLSPAKRSTQGGNYRFQDSRCGFLDPSAIQHDVYMLSPDV
jgi:hypothetical protein